MTSIMDHKPSKILFRILLGMFSGLALLAAFLFETSQMLEKISFFVLAGSFVFCIFFLDHVHPIYLSVSKYIEKKIIEPLLNLAVILLVIGVIIWGGSKVLPAIGDLLTPDTWTLMVCDEKLNSSECMTNTYEIPGFDSKKECLLEGATRFSEQGFECGSNCGPSGYGLSICKEICNKSGCTK